MLSLGLAHSQYHSLEFAIPPAFGGAKYASGMKEELGFPPGLAKRGVKPCRTAVLVFSLLAIGLSNAWQVGYDLVNHLGLLLKSLTVTCPRCICSAISGNIRAFSFSLKIPNILGRV